MPPGPPGPPAASTPSPSVEEGSATFTPPSNNDRPPPPPASLGRPEPPPSSNYSEAPPPPRETAPPPPAADVATPPSDTDKPSREVVTLPPSDAPSAALRDSDIRLGPPGKTRQSASIDPKRATREPPLANVPGKEADTNDEPQAIDLPGFAIATTGVASGIKPFPDGITWLAEKGYRTVLHLRGPGEDSPATRRLFEAKGMRYMSLEVTPARLNRQTYEQFVVMVRNTDLHPLFVYDKDGSAAGGLWFLYNRVALEQSAEKSRSEAQRLGLRTDDDSEHKAMWLAVQKLLASLKP